MSNSLLFKPAIILPHNPLPNRDLECLEDHDPHKFDVYPSNRGSLDGQCQCQLLRSFAGLPPQGHRKIVSFAAP